MARAVFEIKTILEPKMSSNFFYLKSSKFQWFCTDFGTLNTNLASVLGALNFVSIKSYFPIENWPYFENEAQQLKLDASYEISDPELVYNH